MLPALLGEVAPHLYDQYLHQKITAILDRFDEHKLEHPKPEIFKSPPIHYRMRCEFALHTYEGGFEFVMFKKDGKRKIPVYLQKYDPGHEHVSLLMAALKERLPKWERLFSKIFQIDFLCNQAGDTVMSFHYHKKLDNEMFHDALDLSALLSREFGFKVNLCLYAHKQYIETLCNHVVENYQLRDGGHIWLKQIEGLFSQPNAVCCTHMLEFARSCVRGSKGTDLLELYCGSGTFTAALAPFFDKVLATEVSRLPTLAAKTNLKLNGVLNAKLVRLSAEEVAAALRGEREFFRLKQAEVDLKDYNFKTLLIDPPRAGLQDPKALSFTAQFDRIIYISCGPDSLLSDLDYLCASHKITRLSFFDQFPYTEHLESGVLLEKK